jgi:hypothetical protein
VKDWYFLSRNTTLTGEFTTTVPVHSYTFSPTSMTATQIDDLYESSFGNPTLTAAVEPISLTEEPTMIITTEWSIHNSG